MILVVFGDSSCTAGRVTKTTTKLNHWEKQMQWRAWSICCGRFVLQDSVPGAVTQVSVMHSASVLTSHWKVFRRLCYNDSGEQKFLHVESTGNVGTWSLRFIGKVSPNYRGTVIRDGIVFLLKLFPLHLSLTSIDVPFCCPWKHLPVFLCIS